MSMKKKLLSIITPTYNCKDKVEKTIKSVLSQEEQLFEYLIIDGGSTDGTIDVLKKYSKQIRYISEKDNGIYDAMNKGIDRARGHYLYFLGAGDCLKDGILKDLVNKISREGIYFIYGNIERINPFQKIQYNYGYNKWNICTNTICHQAILYHREIFDLTGKYDTNYRINADQIKTIECFGRKEIKKKFIDILIAEYDGSGMSDLEKDKKYFKDKGKIILKNLGFIYFSYHLFRECFTRFLIVLHLKAKVSSFLDKYQKRF
jgi:glycosyltransferase involved in cell wall biosynthesis